MAEPAFPPAADAVNLAGMAPRTPTRNRDAGATPAFSRRAPSLACRPASWHRHRPCTPGGGDAKAVAARVIATGKQGARGIHTAAPTFIVPYPLSGKCR